MALSDRRIASLRCTKFVQRSISSKSSAIWLFSTRLCAFRFSALKGLQFVVVFFCCVCVCVYLVLDARPNCLRLHQEARVEQRKRFCFAELWIPSRTVHHLRSLARQLGDARTAGFEIVRQNSQRVVGSVSGVLLAAHAQRNKWLVVDLPDDKLLTEDNDFELCAHSNEDESPQGDRLRIRFQTLHADRSADAFYVTGYESKKSVDELFVTPGYRSTRHRREAVVQQSVPTKKPRRRPTTKKRKGRIAGRNISNAIEEPTQSTRITLCSRQTPLHLTYQEIGLESIILPK